MFSSTTQKTESISSNKKSLTYARLVKIKRIALPEAITDVLELK